MKILSNEQIREADAYTIINEPVSSIDLMERAARQLFREYIKTFTTNLSVEIFAGPGNNGGDGIALARMLVLKGYTVNLYIIKTGKGLSMDADINFQRLPDNDLLSVSWLDINADIEFVIKPGGVIIDSLFGSGLKRPLDGYAGQLVKLINSFPNIKIAIDIPSGLFSDSNPDHESCNIIKADYTWCFQFPKISFLMPENEIYVGEWKYMDIGLHEDFINNVDTNNYYVTKELACRLIRSRMRFSHKGDFGHALLFAGSSGKLGAAILASRACLRSGVGLLTCHVPAFGVDSMHAAIPEAMLSPDNEDKIISSSPGLENYSAIGAGPGLGLNFKTAQLIEEVISKKHPMVLDADALNIISEKKILLEKLNAGTILTPHPGEFKRLFGDDRDQYSRLIRMREIACKLSVVIVLKGANTVVAGPDGKLWFNSTGNPGMATAGSGDVLTGIILSLLAQGYSSVNAAILGVFIHGLAGDIGAKDKGYEGLIASDIIERLPDAFKSCVLKERSS